MSEFPETHDSLLVQVQDPANRDAWDLFARIYRPAIVRIAMTRGLQHADAQDLAQQVLILVANAIGSWERRDESTRFRHWLSRVTKNAIINALTRRPKDQAMGGSSIEELLCEVVDRDEATTALLENQLRRELYLQAAELIKAEFRPDSWQAFELSVAGEFTIEQVAEQLGKSVGAIYTARSRIMFRLREIIAELGD